MKIQTATTFLQKTDINNETNSMRMIMNPIYDGSTVIHKTYDEFLKYQKDVAPVNGKELNTFVNYGRDINPTIFEASKLISNLEKADYTLLTSCGLSAIHIALMFNVKSGDHILFSDGIYGSTRRMADQIFSRYGIEHSYYDQFDINGANGIEAKLQSNTKVIFFESQASYTFEFANITEIVAFAKKNNCMTICDSTITTPYLLNVLELGVDVCVQSCTKFILGHSDDMLGSISVSQKYTKSLYEYAMFIGNHVSPKSCYNAIRGFATLPLRVEDSIAKTRSIFDAIREHKSVMDILHPYEFSDKERTRYNYTQHTKGSVSLFSVVFKKKLQDCGYDVKEKFFNSFKHFHMGASWGGFSSLCFEANIGNRISKIVEEYKGHFIVRFYIGFEDTVDIVEDLLRAFDTLETNV